MPPVRGGSATAHLVALLGPPPEHAGAGGRVESLCLRGSWAPMAAGGTGEQEGWGSTERINEGYLCADTQPERGQGWFSGVGCHWLRQHAHLAGADAHARSDTSKVTKADLAAGRSFAPAFSEVAAGLPTIGERTEVLARGRDPGGVFEAAAQRSSVSAGCPEAAPAEGSVPFADWGKVPCSRWCLHAGGPRRRGQAQDARAHGARRGGHGREAGRPHRAPDDRGQRAAAGGGAGGCLSVEQLPEEPTARLLRRGRGVVPRGRWLVFDTAASLQAGQEPRAGAQLSGNTACVEFGQCLPAGFACGPAQPNNPS
mmetsp:Transcript_11342/g.33240  ORF Transcript_11342/g.33240 Transcript_11342/m.33240 type:complete len:313 (-) Transcript_11342:475-1413(-)